MSMVRSGRAICVPHPGRRGPRPESASFRGELQGISRRQGEPMEVGKAQGRSAKPDILGSGVWFRSEISVLHARHFCAVLGHRILGTIHRYDIFSPCCHTHRIRRRSHSRYFKSSSLRRFIRSADARHPRVHPPVPK